MPYISLPHPAHPSTGAGIHTPKRLLSVTGEQHMEKKKNKIKSIQLATDTRDNQMQFILPSVNLYADRDTFLIAIQSQKSQMAET